MSKRKAEWQVTSKDPAKRGKPETAESSAQEQASTISPANQYYQRYLEILRRSALTITPDTTSEQPLTNEQRIQLIDGLLQDAINASDVDFLKFFLPLLPVNEQVAKKIIFLLACSNGRVPVVRWLLETNSPSSLFSVNDQGYGPLHMACFNGHAEIARMIIAKDPGLHNSRLHGHYPFSLACALNHLDLAQWLFSIIPEDLRQTRLQETDKDGDSILMLACEGGSLETTRWLLETAISPDQRGAQLKFANPQGENALMKACKSGNIALVTYLLSKCTADEVMHILSQEDKDGKNVFVQACEQGNLTLAQLLLSHVPARRRIGYLKPTGSSPNVFVQACLNGHLETGLWLFHNYALCNDDPDRLKMEYKADHSPDGLKKVMGLFYAIISSPDKEKCFPRSNLVYTKVIKQVADKGTDQEMTKEVTVDERFKLSELAESLDKYLILYTKATVDAQKDSSIFLHSRKPLFEVNAIMIPLELGIPKDHYTLISKIRHSNPTAFNELFIMQRQKIIAQHKKEKQFSTPPEKVTEVYNDVQLEQIVRKNSELIIKKSVIDSFKKLSLVPGTVDENHKKQVKASIPSLVQELESTLLPFVKKKKDLLFIKPSLFGQLSEIVTEAMLTYDDTVLSMRRVPLSFYLSSAVKNHLKQLTGDQSVTELPLSYKSRTGLPLGYKSPMFYPAPQSETARVSPAKSTSLKRKAETPLGSTKPAKQEKTETTIDSQIYAALQDSDTGILASLFAQLPIDSSDKLKLWTFFTACSEGNQPVVEWMLENEKTTPFLRTADPEGFNPFIIACGKGYLYLAKFLLEKNPDFLESVTAQGCNALMHACAKDKIDVVRWLVEEVLKEKSEEYLQRTFNGDTAFAIAVASNSLETAQYLYNRERDPVRKHKLLSGLYGRNRNLLSLSCVSIEMVQWLASEMSEEQLQKDIKAIDSDGRNAFFYACKAGHLELAQRWLESIPAGPERTAFLTRAIPKVGNIFLEVCRAGHTAIAKWLLGQLPKAQQSQFLLSVNRQNHLAFNLACLHGKLDTAMWLYNQHRSYHEPLYLKVDYTAKTADVVIGWFYAIMASRDLSKAFIDPSKISYQNVSYDVTKLAKSLQQYLNVFFKIAPETGELNSLPLHQHSASIMLAVKASIPKEHYELISAMQKENPAAFNKLLEMHCQSLVAGHISKDKYSVPLQGVFAVYRDIKDRNFAHKTANFIIKSASVSYIRRLTLFEPYNRLLLQARTRSLIKALEIEILNLIKTKKLFSFPTSELIETIAEAMQQFDTFLPSQRAKSSIEKHVCEAVTAKLEETCQNTSSMVLAS